MPNTLALKRRVVRKPAVEFVDQAEHTVLAENHQTAAAVEAEPIKQDSEKPDRALQGLQNAFLNTNLGKPVLVYLMNGIKLSGKIRNFDQFTIILQGSDGIDSLVFKHAISTVMPTTRHSNNTTIHL